MVPQVINVNGDLCTRYQHLEFVLVEKLKPFERNDFGKSAPECLELSVQLNIEFVMCYEMYIFYAVATGDHYFCSTHFELCHLIIGIITPHPTNTPPTSVWPKWSSVRVKFREKSSKLPS